MLQALPLYRLPIKSLDWDVASELELTACQAGQMAYDLKRLVEDAHLDMLADLPEVPYDTDFAVYFQAHIPEDLTAEQAEAWRAYFMLGWYSRVFCLA
jgi:hypothetical protein